ncbi:MAG: S1 RNA-binding domain-containing protein [Candidatus Cloacimonadales bacterium]|jgi:small subunit ribosomal protein S1|nr:S1 RNA-binding domain-containing protein [Candidatus Cloacimonadota bacterium]MDD2649828.1 S1 RNA-binding domain-containing protein [Candidatus Cloacimonadota bacterium]MDX9977776.1 S1 RNA-binding domain-containing protein [Candidatus Cloacimonadales bacterium]
MSDSTNEKNNIDQETEDFGKMLDQNPNLIRAKIKKGDVVEGQIVSITDSHIIVSIGQKQDANAEIGDYMYDGKPELKVGDTIKGFVVKMNDDEIKIAKSLNQSHGNKNLVRDAFNNNVPVKGKVTQAVKGGFSVDVLGIRAFCPISQMDLTINLNPEDFVGKEFDFEIIEFEKNNNIILSRKNFIQKEVNELKEKRLDEINVGDLVTGKVLRLANFGAFIDIGGVEGLMHISEFAWERIERPEDVLKTGDDITVKIIRIEGDRISLSVKATVENPMVAAVNELAEGMIVTCKVLRNEKFGSFVEIKPGVEALIPLSFISRRRINHPSDVLNIGDVVEAKVIRVNVEENKISLSIRDLENNPWDTISELFNVGQEVEGIIESVNEFGAYVKIAEGLVGLLPKSKIARARMALDENNAGETITLIISNIDEVKRRVSLDPLNMPEQEERPAKREVKQRRERKPIEDRSNTQTQNYTKSSEEYQGVPEDNPFNIL